MRTLINLMLLCFALLALTACGGGKGIRHCVDADSADDKPPTCVTVTGDAKADAFYARQDAADAARGSRIAAIADTSDCNGDTACVIAAKALAAVVEAGGGEQRAQQYVPQPSVGARIGLALVGQISPLASAAVAWRSSDNAVRTAEAQFGFLGGVVDSVSTASARSNEAAFGILPQLTPSIGGDQIAGGQHIGHNAGRDLGADGGSVDNSETTTTQVRDINTGTQNSGLIGSGRLDSPNTRTNTDTNNVGPRCTGQDCQRVPLPEPEDEG